MSDALLTSVFIAGIAVLGLLIGSFLNVLIYRVPNGLSIVAPPSACPHCGARIWARDNIPVLSWLLLRGKCRHCAEPISARYPLVEAGTGVFFAAVGLWLSPVLAAALDSLSAARVIAAFIALAAFLYLASISVALAVIDVDTHRLPNSIVLPGYLVGLLLLAAAALLGGTSAVLLSTLVGGAALFLFYLLLALAYPRGMGFGDVKLAGVLGLFLGFVGWGALLVGAFAAFFVGGIFSVGMLAARRVGRKTGIPFGPWMLLGAWIGVFFGRDIAGGYLALFGLK